VPLRLLPLFALPVFFLCSNPAQAAARIVSPWPSAASAEVRVEDVTLRSSDPFSPGDIGHAAARTVGAQLFLPLHAAPDRSTPAVIFLHGSGGLSSERGERYGRELAAMGVASLVIATYDSRTDLALSFIDRVLNITETMFVADAYAGLAYLASRPEIDASHVVLTGFSYGGMAATYAIYAQIADKLAPRFSDGHRITFAGHVAFYAPCIARFRDNRTTGAPLLMLYGQQDELIIPARCEEIANDLRAGGSQVSVISYSGAVHQWDGAMSRRMIGRHLGDCSFSVSRGGRITDDRTGLPMSGPFLRKLILGLCTTSDPYPIGRDESVRMQSNRDFGAFLARVFASAPPRS
jgi:dienelactone hydrolase